MVRVDRLLEFLAIVEEGSIAAAAARVGMTRSTLSRHLSALEEEAGAKLLHRGPNSVRVTLVGELMAERARRISREAEDAWYAVRALSDSPSGPLHVSTPPTELFQELLVAFAVAYPQVRVLVSASHRHVDLHRERVDVALRFGELRDESLIARRLGETRSTLVASPAYLRERGRPESPAELRRHRCVVGYGQSGAPGFEWPLRSGGRLSVEAHFACEGLMAGLRAAIAGVGIALLPEGLTSAHRDAGLLEFVLEDVVGMNVVGQLVYLERRLLLSSARAFIDFTVDYFEHHPELQPTLIPAIFP